MIDYTIHKTTIFLFIFILVCVVILTYYTKKEGFGYYQNYFPPNPKHDDRIMLDNEQSNLFSPFTPIKNNKKPLKPYTKTLNNSNVLFEFPKNTPREIMVRYISDMFKQKASIAYTNVIDVKIEREGSGESEYLDLHSEQSMNLKLTDKNFENVSIIVQAIKTRPSRISIPQVNHTLRIPLEFVEKGVVAKIGSTKIAAPINYFLHYFFDPFYCNGLASSDARFKIPQTTTTRGLWDNIDYNKNENTQVETVVGKDDSNYDFVVKPDSLLDCKWENRDTKIESCKTYPHMVKIARPIAVEPDSDSHVRNYVTPGEDIDRCEVKRDYIKVWDARGVPIEKQQKDIKLDQYIPHPSMFENNLTGLYDDVFGMSRIIPSFPTGRGTGGR